MFRSWMTTTRPRPWLASRTGGGEKNNIASPNNEKRGSWFDIMDMMKEVERDREYKRKDENRGMEKENMM